MKIKKQNSNNQNQKQSGKTAFIITVSVIAILIVSIIAWTVIDSGKERSTSKNNDSQSDSASFDKSTVFKTEKDLEGLEYETVLFTMTDGQSFTMNVYPEIAPKAAENFLNLVRDGFYDNLTFHRVIAGFMAQGGDPEGTGMGGSDKTIYGEFESNGYYNPLSHQRGVVSMARSNEPDSASSQFFICYGDASYLDGDYAAFGFVTEGMETVDSFLSGGTDSSDRPLKDVRIQSAEIITGKSGSGNQTTSATSKSESSDNTTDNSAPSNSQNAPIYKTLEDLEALEYKTVEFVMTDGQSFKMNVYPEIAPRTVENFITLVNSGFYDNLIFHRVIDGFMAQGGDPEGTGMGGSDNKIYGEFASNGYPNPLSHQRGVVSMARSNDPNSASSQFFICYADASFLDGDYAAFGFVTEGMETVDSFLSDGTDSSDKPLKDVRIQSARVVG